MVHDRERTQRRAPRRRRGARDLQGRRPRPRVPRAHDNGQQPLLVSQAPPLEVHGDVRSQQVELSELVRLPVPREPEG